MTGEQLSLLVPVPRRRRTPIAPGMVRSIRCRRCGGTPMPRWKLCRSCWDERAAAALDTRWAV
jgi:hypothetical protein